MSVTGMSHVTGIGQPEFFGTAAGILVQRSRNSSALRPHYGRNSSALRALVLHVTERENPLSHRYVTCDRGRGVTATRPDPTRPTVVTVVCSVGEDVNSIHQAVTRGRSMDGTPGAGFGGGW